MLKKKKRSVFEKNIYLFKPGTNLELFRQKVSLNLKVGDKKTLKEQIKACELALEACIIKL